MMNGVILPPTKGLADVVTEGNLRRDIDGELYDFRPSGFDIEVLKLANDAINERVPLGLLLPVGGLRVAPVLAASILVQQFMESRRLTAKVAVVSKQLTLRSFYNSFYITDQRLADFFPLEIILPNGKLSRLAKPFSKGRFRFALNIARLESLGDQYEGIIIEAGTGTPEEVDRIISSAGDNNISLIYLTTDPFDPILERIVDKGIVCAWAPEEIAELVKNKDSTDAICADVDVLYHAAETRFKVIGSDKHEDLDNVLSRLWSDLQALQKKSEHLLPIGLRWGWAVFAGLSRLPIPVHYFDRQACSAWRTTTLGDAPVQASEFAQNATVENDRELWQVFAADISDALDAIGNSVKPDTLSDWVTERCDKGSGLVVVQNKAVVAAIPEFLDERPGIPLKWREHIRFATFNDLERGRKAWCAESTLFSGPIPWSRAGLLATPATQELVVLTHGPWETGRVIRQIRSTEQRLRDIACGSIRERAIEKLGSVIPRLRSEYLEIVPDIIHTSVKTVRTKSSDQEPIWNPFGVQIARDLGVEDDSDIISDPNVGQDSTGGKTRALVVTLSDGIGFFHPDLLVSRIREGQEQEVAIKSLRSGDRLVLVDNGVRTDLFQLIVNKLEAFPEFAGIVGLVREWQSHASKFVIRGEREYEFILKRMKELGTAINSPATVRNWVYGIVHGPRDAKDIKRFGKVINNDYLVHRWQALGRALKTMRGHRMKIGKMLAKAIQGAIISDSDVFFDKSLGIHLSELSEAITDHAVVSISDDIVVVPSHVANILLKPEDANIIQSNISKEG